MKPATRLRIPCTYNLILPLFKKVIVQLGYFIWIA